MKEFLGFAAIGYLLLVGAVYVFQRSLIYYPAGGRPEPAAYGVADMAAVSLRTGDGLDLLAWWKPPADGAAPVLAFFHGNAGHIGYRGAKLRPYLDRGWGVLLPAWRGYSGNPGSPSEDGLYADGRAALAFLAARGIDGDRVVLYGESLGAAIAIQMATETKVAAVVLEAPFSSVADIGARMFPYLPVRLLARDRFENAAKIAAVGAPVLVLHGEADKTVPVAHGRRVFAAAAEPKSARFVAAAGHNDLHSFGVADTVMEFVRSHTGGGQKKIF